MNGQAFQERGKALYGYGWQTRISKELGISRSTVVRLMARRDDIPKPFSLALDALQAERVREIEASSSVASVISTIPGSAGAGLSLPTPAPTADPQ